MNPNQITQINLLAAIAFGIFVIAFLLALFVFSKINPKTKKLTNIDTSSFLFVSFHVK